MVSGGRAIKNAEDFERIIGGLADALGARLVVPCVGGQRHHTEPLQVGQTGRSSAGPLHRRWHFRRDPAPTGMKDTKVVAINKDADAPIFEVADFGLVGDAYQVVPELIEKLKK